MLRSQIFFIILTGMILCHSSAFAQTCTNTNDCHDRSVNPDPPFSNGKCQCQPCIYNWTGDQCQTCPPQYDQTFDCADCNYADGYAGVYPNCFDNRCNITSMCNATNARGITGTVETGCRCLCRNAWSGARCDVCPVGTNESNACGSCLPGYFDYPFCSPLCTNQGNCSGHAQSVSGTYASGCSCTCAKNWTSSNCSVCPVGYNASLNCAACADGYEGYPHCALSCTFADCSNHAVAVSGTVVSGCQCLCAAKWYGPTCAACPSGMNATAGCNQCIDGYSGFPNCSFTCTIETNCSNHASSVSGTSLTGCSCACRNQWKSTNCSECPFGVNAADDCGSCIAGYQDYPACVRTCTVDQDCAGHALSVSGVVGSCVCQCRNQWSQASNCSSCTLPYGGADCNECAVGYVGYPNCIKNCSVGGDCSNHATSVVGFANGTCACACRNGWYGPTCALCPARYNSSLDCGFCADSYEGRYPDCLLRCTVSANCSNHATSVYGNTTSGCYCQCRSQWNGPTCSACPDIYNASKDCADCANAYENYPLCPLKCTVAANCSNHASLVTGNVVDGCNCTCTKQWYGSRCNQCPQQYNPNADCGACATGHQTYPQCYLACTVASNCSGHATSVSGNTNTGCRCTCEPNWNGTASCSACANQWSGAACDSCPVGYNASRNCGACASGYAGYPNCEQLCTVDADCGGHAVSVSGFVGSCVCSCRNQWSGPTCANCLFPYDASRDCGACVAGYDTYPQCYLTCTVASNCSGQATRVTGNSFTGCNCTCANQWYGQYCSNCPAFVNASADCAACDTGYGGYPNCQQLCTVDADCYDHATSVQGFRGRCNCTCRNQWTSNSYCSVCPTRFNSTEDCGACAVGYENYPRCDLQCTIASNCSNHATQVTGNVAIGCNCTCENQWYGPSCALCPFNFDARQNCGACASGYSDYPRCSRVCTNSEDCSSHAANVSGLVPNCVCQCRNSWSGDRCESCAVRYNTSQDCGTCADAYAAFSVYPDCYLSCTTAANCSSHAVAVTGNTQTLCNCTCRNQWSGPQCGVCPANFNAAQDCGTCAAGYLYYPRCVAQCTIALNCSSHATAVTGAIVDGCNCTCRNQWFDAACGQCPALVNASRDCGACVDGYGGYPSCRRQCTTGMDCNGHAISASGLLPNCSCVCRKQWTSIDCSVCPVGVNASNDCGSCEQKYDSYPSCSLTCTVAANCSNHASQVRGNSATGCSCSCRNQWATATCSTCDAKYNASDDCASCAAGYDDYPRCDRICTSTTDCSDHAATVTGLFPYCNCTCRNQWQGSSCSRCPIQYNASNDCLGCAEGYDGAYPACYLTCTREANCSAHAVNVSGNAFTGCNCTCRNQWNGSSCQMCPSIFNQDQDCGTCAEGYGFYPECRRVCSTKYECSSHASSVTGDYPNCTCQCRNQWLGGTCDVCPAQYNASVATDCGTCSAFREGYPICVPICQNALNCSGNARLVLGNYSSGCTCECRNQWTSANCSLCAANYDRSLDCGACARGFGSYPICAPLCTPSDCYNNSVRFAGVRPNCSCTCRNQWSLSNCSVCPPRFESASDCSSCAIGYTAYPSCWRLCTIAADCSNHAWNVSGNEHSGCQCRCRNNWTGGACESCPPQYNASNDCFGCAEGYEGTYPLCYRTCTIEQDCSGNAVAVTGNLNTGCNCTCRNQWIGPRCARCPVRYDVVFDCGACDKYYNDDYPNCTGLSRSRPTPSLEQTVSANELSVTQTLSASASLSDNETVSDSPSATRSRERTVTPPLTPPPTETTTTTTTTEMPTTTTTTTSTTAPTTNTTTTTTTTTTEAPTTTSTTTTTTTTEQPTTTTSSPNTSTTTHVPTTTTTTTTAAPNTTTTSTTTTTAVPNITTTSTTTAAPTTTTTTEAPTTPCTIEGSCSGHATSVQRNNLTSQCECTCSNQWTSAQCNTCPSVYNSSLDCAACSGQRVNYPQCAALTHLVIAVNLTCPVSSYGLPVDRFTQLVGQDVRSQIVETSCFPTTGQGVAAVNLTVVVYSMLRDGLELRLDGQLLAMDDATLRATATCAAGYIEGRSFELRRTTAAAGDTAADCNSTWPAAVVISAASPCGPILCGAMTSGDNGGAATFPWYYIVAGVVGAVVLGAAVWFLVRRVAFQYRSESASRYNDAGKYTLEFLPDANDEDIQVLSKRRATIVEVNAEEGGGAAGSRRPPTRRMTRGQSIMAFFGRPAAAAPNEEGVAMEPIVEEPLRTEPAAAPPKVQHDFSDI